MRMRCRSSVFMAVIKSLFRLPCFLPGRLPFSRRNQVAQTVVDIEAPCAGTAAVALDGGDQTDVRKAKFGLVVFPGDLKDNLRAVPLGRVFDKVNLAVQGTPDDFLPRHEFSDRVGAAVSVFVAELKLSTQLVGPAVDFF